MSWIHDNKFAATLAGITAVGSISLLYLSMQKSDVADEAKQNLEKLMRDEKALMENVPYPDAENQEEIESSALSFAQTAVKLQQQFLAYRPESLTDFSPADFTPKLIEYSKGLKAEFKRKGVEFPTGGYFGFDAYASKSPKQQATGELEYQLRASQWLFTQLADVAPEKLINVVRPSLAIELDEVAPVVDKRPARRNNRNANQRNNTGKKSVPVYDAMPMEIAFHCTEAQFVDFYEKLVNSSEFCFAVRSLRVQNEVGRPPSADDAKFEEPINKSLDGVDIDGLPGFDAPESNEIPEISEEPEAPEAPEAEGDLDETSPAEAPGVIEVSSDTAQILKQVLGAEKINVYMQLELLVFKPDTEVGLGKTAGIKEGPTETTNDQ